MNLLSYRQDYFLHYHVPTHMIFGPECVLGNVEPIAECGSKALVVMGQGSALRNGAYAHMCAALHRLDLAWAVFEGVEPNPSFSTVERGVELGKKEHVNMVVGIGGGSAIDAAKAMAMLLANPDWSIEACYTAPENCRALPMVAIPTTSGTGTEVTPFAVLTDPIQNLKRAIRHSALFPALAYMDPTYTYSASRSLSVDTALDAFSHLVEGYLSTRADWLSERLAEQGLSLFLECLPSLRAEFWNTSDREKLMMMSTLAGMVIAVGGTITAHALSYHLTTEKKIPHGRAVAFLLPEQIRLALPSTPKAGKLLRLLNFQNTNTLKSLIHEMVDPPGSFSESELQKYVERALPSQNHKNNPFSINAQVLLDIFKASLDVH